MAEPQPRVVAPGRENPFQRDTYTIEPATDTSFDINDDVGLLASLSALDIRNGRLSDPKSLFVRPTIGSVWHWRPIVGLQPSLSIAYVDAYIRTYKCALSGLPATIYTNEQKHKLALVLGVSRAVMTKLYNLESLDFIPGEVGTPFLKIMETANGETRFETTGNLTQAQRTLLTERHTFSEAEKAAISSIHMCAIGVLPVQGYSVMMCGRHYQSDKSSQSFRAFQVMERQFWSSSAVKTWWDDNVDMLRDALFHKAGHPVLISLKVQLAMDPKTCEMLKTEGCGSAAARLPAQEPEAKAANSYRRLCQTVRTLFESYGGYLNFVALDHALAAVDLCKVGGASDLKAETRPPTVPDWVVDRRTAIDYLRMMLTGHSDMVAYCYGFYVALSDAAQAASGSAAVDTLRTSYSLSKLMNQSAAAFTAGREAYKRRIRSEGSYVPASLLFVGGKPLPEGTVPTGVVVSVPPNMYAAGPNV